MFSRRLLLIVVVLVVSVAAFAYFHGTTGAQEMRFVGFDRVSIVTYASGLTGFFDRPTGTLYVYDANWDKCVAVRKLTALGAPMTSVDKPRR